MKVTKGSQTRYNHLILNLKNGQINFENLTSFAAKFSKCV